MKKIKWQQRKPVRYYFEWDSPIRQLSDIRGIENVSTFLYPTYEVLHDPYLLKNIDIVAHKIIKAISENKKIGLSYDHDTDGLTAGTVMYRYLSQFTDNIYKIYNERHEGHGIENQFDKIEYGTELLIIVDSSSNSTKTCETLSKRGVEIVILDHHTIDEDNPYATIVNPQQDDYPNKQLSGVGIVYKTIQVMDDTLATGDIDRYLDLVAVGLYGDMMSVNVLENRYLIKQGLKNINNPGLQAILKINNIDLKKIDTQTIGFKISPSINAAARMGNIKLVVDLLSEDDYKKCLELAQEIYQLNEERKKIEDELFLKYESMIDDNDKVIIIPHPEAQKNFNGLIANKISQKYKRPAMVLRDHGDKMMGSFRSYGDFKLKKFLRQLPFIDYAEGHEASGGVGFDRQFHPILREIFQEELKDEDFDFTIEYDLEINLEDVDIDLIKQLSDFNLITGVDFEKVIFKINHIKIDDMKVVGVNQDTIRIKSKDVVVMMFKVSESVINDLNIGDVIEVIGGLNINEWFNPRYKKNIITPQIFAEDYMKSVNFS